MTRMEDEESKEKMRYSYLSKLILSNFEIVLTHAPYMKEDNRVLDLFTLYNDQARFLILL